jgi:hypothetical protein
MPKVRKFMKSIHLIHWNAPEAQEKATILRKLGYDVACELPTPAILHNLKKTPPSLFLIDLSRLPSQGRDVALNLRQGKISRFIPLVFVDGAPEKVANIRKHLPDAVYTTWDNINGVIGNAINHPLKNPVVPRSALQGYADAPLVKKLGIKSNSVVILINAPAEFRSLLGDLPDVVKFSNRGKGDLIIWFVKLKDISKPP